MARGGHGLPKVSPKSAMPYPSTPCGRATPRRTPMNTSLRHRVHRIKLKEEASSQNEETSENSAPFVTPLSIHKGKFMTRTYLIFLL
jgi:hypothetical protein